MGLHCLWSIFPKTARAAQTIVTAIRVSFHTVQRPIFPQHGLGCTAYLALPIPQIGLSRELHQVYDGPTTSGPADKMPWNQIIKCTPSRFESSYLASGPILLKTLVMYYSWTKSSSLVSFSVLMVSTSSFSLISILFQLFFVISVSWYSKIKIISFKVDKPIMEPYTLFLIIHCQIPKHKAWK